MASPLIIALGRIVLTVALTAGTAYVVSFAVADYVSDKAYDGLQTTVSTVATSLERVQGSVGTLQASVGEVAGATQQMTANVGALGGSISDLTGQVGDLGTQIATEIERLRTERAQLAADISVQVAELLKEQEFNQERFDRLEERLDEGFTDLRERVERADATDAIVPERSRRLVAGAGEDTGEVVMPVFPETAGEWETFQQALDMVPFKSTGPLVDGSGNLLGRIEGLVERDGTSFLLTTLDAAHGGDRVVVPLDEVAIGAGGSLRWTATSSELPVYNPSVYGRIDGSPAPPADGIEDDLRRPEAE